MKPAFRIWALAIIYQNILFALLPTPLLRDAGPALLFLIPIELAGGLPGLFLYGAIMHGLGVNRSPLKAKWAAAILGALFAALATTVLTAMFFGIDFKEMTGELASLIYPAPLAALLSLLTFASSVNAYLNENTIEKHP